MKKLKSIALMAITVCMTASFAAGFAKAFADDTNGLPTGNTAVPVSVAVLEKQPNVLGKPVVKKYGMVFFVERAVVVKPGIVYSPARYAEFFHISKDFGYMGIGREWSNSNTYEQKLYVLEAALVANKEATGMTDDEIVKIIKCLKSIKASENEGYRKTYKIERYSFTVYNSTKELSIDWRLLFDPLTLGEPEYRAAETTKAAIALPSGNANLPRIVDPYNEKTFSKPVKREKKYGMNFLVYKHFGSKTGVEYTPAEYGSELSFLFDNGGSVSCPFYYYGARSHKEMMYIIEASLMANRSATGMTDADIQQMLKTLEDAKAAGHRIDSENDRYSWGAVYINWPWLSWGVK